MAKNKSLLGMLVSEWPVKALSLAAAIMLFIFHNFSTLSERFISVELRAVFADGLTAAQPYPRRVRVEIRGNDRSLASATEEDISAYADFSRFTDEGSYTAPVTIQKKGVLDGLDTIEIRVAPLEITLPIEKKIRKRVEVTPVFKGLPSTGYRLEHYSINPAGVDIEGPQGIAQDITSISTEDIDLSGKRETFSARVRLLTANPLLTFPGGDTVDFRGQITELLEQKTFEDIPLTLQGLSSDLTMTETVPDGSVTVQGGRNVIESLKRDSLRLIVNCAGLAESGTYTLEVQPLVPQGFSVVRFDPGQITIIIHSGGKADFR